MAFEAIILRVRQQLEGAAPAREIGLETNTTFAPDHAALGLVGIKQLDAINGRIDKRLAMPGLRLETIFHLLARCARPGHVVHTDGLIG